MKSFTLSLGGGGAQKVLDPRFSHFVAPPPLPVINDQSLTQGSHRDWRTWKMKVVKEKSWNMQNWPKVMEFCDKLWNFTNFPPEFD